ncbi:MAG TPA: VOC family protein [Chitinophagaceae bacterium]|nr:VOC family protein [Chitinophagaceae bacterium]
MKTVNPYLNFPGTAEAAFTFYKSIFGGEFTSLQRFKDTPDGGRIPPGEGEKIMHISLPLGNGNILMATDALESMGHPLTVGNNFHLTLEAESEEEANKLFNGLSAGGSVSMPMAKTFWGAYFGMATDKFGVQWMINYSLPPSK